MPLQAEEALGPISIPRGSGGVGNNKLWPDMQKESWNIQLTKILICSHTFEWDRFVTLTGAQAEWGLRYRIYMKACSDNN
jgi:hypothetical protein